MNLTWQQIALVAVILAGVIAAHVFQAGVVETALVSTFGVLFAGLASLGKGPPSPPAVQS